MKRQVVYDDMDNSLRITPLIIAEGPLSLVYVSLVTKRLNQDEYWFNNNLPRLKFLEIGEEAFEWMKDKAREIVSEKEVLKRLVKFGLEN